MLKLDHTLVWDRSFDNLSNEDKLRVVRSRIEYCYREYWGCDWCCGRGDEEVRDLEAMEARLEVRLGMRL